MGWRRRGWAGPWPGRGPFSYLPPWQRPGWIYGGRGFGRGWWGPNPYVCARLPWLPRGLWADPAYAYPPAAPTGVEAVAALEDYKKELTDEKVNIEQEISDLEVRTKELKTRLEQEKGQAPGQ
jgi:hypothetical protein